MSDDFEKQLEATRPADCVNNPTDPETFKQSQESFAMQTYGKPFGELPRRDQRAILRILNGHVQEYKAQIDSLRRNNMLTVQERAMRMASRLADIDSPNVQP